jgi:hypothetical protein
MSPISNRNVNNKFSLVLHELYHPNIHGFDDDSDSNINGHFLVHSCYHSFKLVENGIIHENILLDDIEYNYYNYIRSRQIMLHHPIIRNYRNIISGEKFMKPEIAECIILSGGECVCILKTFWLCLIQRTWKRIYKERQCVLSRRCHPESIHYRQIHGIWDPSCRVLPGLKSMLSYLK